ncbi:Facilitated trehalose transporter Tret1-2 homolog [Eumeta japonica]|uniref:Facilitated trehalose transporter Tret1-2 homolog n=1 Tax=Eumeta variegata TaxID=151549 RepID=A0A4C1VPH5_EUMVA|nr:Facilitated trehalose transporter Tret1-2 homolog [Eumeta japonica]
MEIHEKRKRKVQYWSALAVSLSSLCLAAVATWPTPALYKFHSREVNFQLTEKEISWLLAISPIGLLVGSALSRYLAENFGRKTTILISSLPMMIGSLIALIGWNAWFLYLARFVWGLGTGVAGTVTPMYIAEISAKDIRGKLMTFSRVLGNLGSLIVIAGGPFVSYAQINLFLCVTPLVYLTACCFIPESPYYYLKDGRTNEARRVMFILEETKDMQLKELQKALKSIFWAQSLQFTARRTQKEEMSRGTSIRELVTGRVYWKPLIISAGLVASAVVDLFGRRLFFITSSLCLGITLFVVGVYFFLQKFTPMSSESLYPYAIVAIVGIVMSNVISTLGLAPMSCIIPAEIFPLNVKSTALSAVNMFAALLGSAAALSYQHIENSWDLYGLFWFYGSVATVGGVLTYVLLPETKDKTLEEIQMEMQGRTDRSAVDDDVVELQIRLCNGYNKQGRDDKKSDALSGISGIVETEACGSESLRVPIEAFAMLSLAGDQNTRPFIGL